MELVGCGVTALRVPSKSPPEFDRGKLALTPRCGEFEVPDANQERDVLLPTDSITSHMPARVLEFVGNCCLLEQLTAISPAEEAHWGSFLTQATRS